MLKELNQNEFGSVLPLFRGLDHCLALQATVEGHNPGRIFVDSTDNPCTALALTVGGYFLAGDDSNQETSEALRSFLAEQIFTGRVHLKSSTSMFLTLHPETWDIMAEGIAVYASYTVKGKNPHSVAKILYEEKQTGLPRGNLRHRKIQETVHRVSRR